MKSNAPSDFFRPELEEAGFVGWLTFGELLGGKLAEVPCEGGAYVVYRTSDEPPAFLEKSPGGHFQGRDPTVSVETLKARWVPEASVMYIGKADDLRRRLREFARFGAGKPVGHRGGRYVWQLADSGKLLVAWRTLLSAETPSGAEAVLMRRFVELYGGRLPFANIAGPRGG